MLNLPETYCRPRTEKGRTYIIEAAQRLFEAVPDLGGFVDITAGERVTTCQSMDGYVNCPRCSRYSRGENLSYVVGLHKEGMRRAGSDAPFISWTYGFREWKGEAFLEYLAAITYGKSVAKQVAKAWELFTKGYQNYPTNIMFSYYGPMHDGVVWDLSLLPKNIQQPRSWYFTDDRRGDRISEVLQCGHTLEEAITLCEAICTHWEQGVAALPREYVGELNTLADALNVLFHSGTNILRFYALREQLGYGRGEPRAILEQMRAIVQEEICHSETMIALCEQDNRLGYHPEAGAFKYHPGRLTERIQHLKELLETEFSLVEQRLAEGKPPLAYYVAEGCEGYALTDAKDKAAWSPVADKGAVRLYYDSDNLYLDVQCAENSMVDFSFEYRLLWPSPQMRYRNGAFDVEDWHRQYHGLFGETLEKERAKYRFTKTEDGFSVVIDRRLLLGKHEHSPGSYGWLIPNT